MYKYRHLETRRWSGLAGRNGRAAPSTSSSTAPGSGCGVCRIGPWGLPPSPNLRSGIVGSVCKGPEKGKDGVPYCLSSNKDSLVLELGASSNHPAPREPLCHRAQGASFASIVFLFFLFPYEELLRSSFFFLRKGYASQKARMHNGEVPIPYRAYWEWSHQRTLQPKLDTARLGEKSE
eukprot:1149508-Pelagomonas_calceolata.AAC.1